MKTAVIISEKSPIAILGTKRALNAMKIRQVQKGLDYVRTWNMSQIYTNDIAFASAAIFQKIKPEFPKL